MSTYRVTLLLSQEGCDPGEMPWVVDAYDEYTEDNNQGEPDEYAAKKRPESRELIIEIDEKAVLDLFSAPTVKAVVFNP